jgi:hypothetical protein
MLTKPILLAFLVACGVNSSTATIESATEQHDKKPPDERTDQHFCCQSVDPESKTGDDCIAIGPNQIDACANVLTCPGSWAKQDGKVVCK